MSARTSIPSTPNQNNDAAERARRRQSSSARARQSIRDVARQVTETPIRGRQGQRSVNSSEHEEWLNMVRSNRVVSNNAFTIPIIDTFYSILQGEELEENPGIFRQASQTLGGCVTVYKTRVGRISEDTTQLIVSLREGHKARDQRGEGEESADEGDSDNSEVSRRTSDRRRQKQPDQNSHMVSEEKLRIDTHELQTTFDPVLLKMSRDFDKRGPESLLQYFLMPDDDALIVLNTDSDATERPIAAKKTPAIPAPSAPKLNTIVEEDEEEEEEEENSIRRESDNMEVDDNTSHVAETSFIRDAQPSANPSNQLTIDLAQQAISFFENVRTSESEILPLVPQIVAAVDNPQEECENLFKEMKAWSLANPEDHSLYIHAESEDAADGDAAAEPTDIREYGVEWAQVDQNRQEDEDMNEYVVLPDDLPSEFDNGEDNSVLSNINTQLPPDGNWLDISYLTQLEHQPKNWSGPSHWKIRRLATESQQREQSLDPNSSNASETSVNSRSRSRRMAKVPIVIDFTDEEEVDLKELFKSGKKSTLMPPRETRLDNEYLLPTDLHIKAVSLLTLALMPKQGVSKNLRQQGQDGLDDFLQGAGDHTDELAMDTAGFDESFGGGDDTGVHSINGFPASETVSQMFGSSQVPGSTDNGQLNYSRTAKRVDIRLLKNNVWEAIETSKEASKSDELSLREVIKETQPKYNELQRSNLSPALYFISLLHLTNEQGLHLKNTAELTDVIISTE